LIDGHSILVVCIWFKPGENVKNIEILGFNDLRLQLLV
jgi:hypothetical protein